MKEAKELNLCEILKDCQAGTKLYSPILGEVYFYCVLGSEGKILVRIKECSDLFEFRKDGKAIVEDPDYPIRVSDDVMLFPSKDYRDWSTFKPKVERFDKKTLKPFDRVLVRVDIDGFAWTCNLFSHFNKDGEPCGTENYPTYIIPYNDDTKHLVGTTDDAPEYYRYWED